MKTKKTKYHKQGLGFTQHPTLKRLVAKFRHRALMILFFLILGNRFYAQNCSITLTQTPSSAICAGAQVTLNASASAIGGGTGVNGALTVNSAVYTDGTKSAVRGNNPAGSNKLRLSSTSNFNAGNEVLIITMIDGNTSNNLAGQYEFITIASVSGDTLIFGQNLINTYNYTSSLKHQAIKVPQYTNVIVNNNGTLTCDPWNGSTGGVLCFRASGNVMVNNGGLISANGKGYRGVSHTAMYRNANGAQGEGYFGQGYTGGTSTGANGTWNNANSNGGGGGTGLQDAGGGAGGSYRTAGYAGIASGGHNGGVGGNVAGNASLTTLFMGGAGGEGGADEDGAVPGAGGNGGGIIYFSANSVSISGTVTACGANGGAGSNSGGGSGCGMAGGGGGAGGSVYLSTNTITASGAILVDGGLAGASNGCGGTGGAGGSGRIRLDAQGSIPVTSPASYQGSVPLLSGLTYSWSNGATGSVIAVSPSVTTSYSVTITSTTGCYGTTRSSIITVNPLPVLNVTGNNTICAGSSLTLSASGANTYTWSTGSNSTSLVLSPSSNTTYTLNGRSSLGCNAIPVITNVTVSAIPVISVNSGSICSGSSFTISPSGAASYSIQGGASIVSPGTSSTYTVTGSSAYGCEGNVVNSSVTVNPLPVLSITGTGTLCAGSSSTLTANGAASYLWDQGGNTSAIVVSPTASTVYSVNGISAAGCTSSLSKTITVNNLPVISMSGNTVICNGDVTVLTASGAATYLWSNGATSNSISVSPSVSTTYSVLGTSVDGCNGASPTVTLTVNPLPVVTLTGTNSICNGNTALLTAGGAATYLWGNAATSNSIAVSPSSTTTYSLIGTSAAGCTANAVPFTLTVNALPTVVITGTTALCAGKTITLTAGGATSYVWNTTSTLSTIVLTPTANSSYAVTGSDAFGCVNTASFALTVNALPMVSISGTNAVCAGNSAVLNANGALSYIWSNGSTGSSVSVNPSATTSYSVSGTDANGCIGNSTLKAITVNALPLVTISGASALCAGASTTLTANGAVSYNWSNGATAASIVVTPSVNTTYSLSGTNSFGCVANASAATVTVNPLPTVTISGTTAVCAGNSATLTASGASTYVWNTAANGNSVSVSPSANTSYTVSGTSAAGCVNTSVKTVSVNALPIVAISGTNAVCAGNAATLTASGAVTYAWSNGATSSSIIVSPSVSTNYSVTGISAAGCVGYSSLTNVSINALPVVSISGNSVICAGTQATLTASGAATYNWSNGSTSSSIVVSPASTTVYSVSGNSSVGCLGNSAPKTLAVNSLPVIGINGATALCAGNTLTLCANGASSYLWNTNATTALISVNPLVNTSYTVLGTDLNGCVGTAVKSLTVNALPIISISGNAFICNGDNTTLNASGALNYIWSNASNTTSINVTPASNTTYSVSGSDANACVGNAQITVTVNALPVITINGNTTLCAGNAATLTASGALSYVWNTAASVNSIVVSPLASTSYSVIGTDANGCMGNSLNTTVTVNALPLVQVNTSSAICAGDSLNLVASGAVSYSWSNGATTASLFVSPAASTSYTVIGTDANACVNSAISNVTVNVLPVLSISGNNTICMNDSTELTVNGASSYTWNTGATVNSVTVSPISNASYSVMGTDANGCKATASNTVIVNALPLIVVSAPNSVCLGDSATITASGASTYTWSNGATTNNIVLTPSSSVVYLLNGTSAAGCVGTAFTGSLNVNALPVISINGSSVVCKGSNTMLSATGAANYIWSNGSTFSTLQIAPVTATVYTVKGTDAQNCSSTGSIAVNVNPVPLITIVATATAVCAGETLSLSANGASVYSWNTGSIDSNIVVSPVVNTQYSVIGLNNFNCSATQTIDIIANDCTGLSHNKASAGFRLYPNPNNGEFVVELSDYTNSSIVIVNALGEIVLSQKAEASNAIQLNNLSNGMYFVRVCQNNLPLFSTPVIKQ